MPTASIVAVGTELLFGQVINSNAAYISEQLQLLGVSVLFHFTVGDNPTRLKETLSRAAGESDIVLTTGGLGPTQDDLTKELIAELCGVPLEKDDEAFRRLDKIMKGFGHKNYTENNLKQMYLPKGSTAFYNEVGTAPGFALEHGSNTFIAMPGPPREMKEMMSLNVIPYLSKKSEAVIFSKILRFYGIGESALETALLPVIDGQTDPTVATYAKEGECAIRVSSRRKTEEEAAKAVEETIKKIKELAGEYLYSEEDEDYPQVIVNLLLKKKLKLAAAESCTGGLFSGAITSVPGASDVFERSFVTYSNEAKKEMIGVTSQTLDEDGAVSKTCAREMAEGVLKFSAADIAISVTGIAGPGGGTQEKPIGTVFFAIKSRDGKLLESEKHFNDRGRRINRHVCVLEMCDMIRRFLA